MAELQYVLEVEPLDLGADVKAVGLDLVEIESREPAHGANAARLWAATLGALPGTEPWAFDFFSHLDRVRDYCRLHAVPFEEKASGHSIVIPALFRRCAGCAGRAIRGRSFRRSRRRDGIRGRPFGRKRIGQTRRGRLPLRIPELFILRGVRFREWVSLHCSPKNCGPAKSCVESSPQPRHCPWKWPAHTSPNILQQLGQFEGRLRASSWRRRFSGRRRHGAFYFDHPRALYSVAARRIMGCPTANWPMRVTVP